MPISKAVFRSIARRCAAQELVPHGFNQVTGLGYVRHSSPVIQSLDVRIDRYEPSYTINFGFHYDWVGKTCTRGRGRCRYQ